MLVIFILIILIILFCFSLFVLKNKFYLSIGEVAPIIINAQIPGGLKFSFIVEQSFLTKYIPSKVFGDWTIECLTFWLWEKDKGFAAIEKKIDVVEHNTISKCLDGMHITIFDKNQMLAPSNKKGFYVYGLAYLESKIIQIASLPKFYKIFSKKTTILQKLKSTFIHEISHLILNACNIEYERHHEYFEQAQLKTIFSKQ